MYTGILLGPNDFLISKAEMMSYISYGRYYLFAVLLHMSISRDVYVQLAVKMHYSRIRIVIGPQAIMKSGLVHIPHC